jgi:hypothetical protein
VVFGWAFGPEHAGCGFEDGKNSKNDELPTFLTQRYVF